MDTDPQDDRTWVLLPGTLCTQSVFDDFLDAGGVARNRRVEIELRYPRVDDYTESLIDALPKGAVVCGFSLGAILAAHFADRIKASELVLFGLNPMADASENYTERRALQHEVETLGVAKALSTRLPLLSGTDPKAARLKILKMAQASAKNIDAQTELALSRPCALDALRNAQIPVTLLTGSEDQHTPLHLAKESASAAPKGRAIVIPGLGHYALVEDGNACWRAYSERSGICL